MVSSINLTPNPRILQMLGQIEFENWQCIAELVDNSIDALLKDFSIGRTEKGEIRVSIPTFTQYTEGLPISVWDNGPGMSANQLENALKAGYSSNDPTSNLGLFGMGFNIATARIGDRTSVFTSQKGEQNEIGIEIDFQEMVQNNSYDRPVLTKSKDNSYISGTTIKIYKLKERVSYLGQQGISSLKKQLSKVYSKLIRDYNMDIYVNGDKLIPNRKCIWSPERYVFRNQEKVPAYIEVLENLGDMYFCSCCWNWLDVPVVEEITPICKICDTSQFVNNRERVITGWLGIQRYFDKDEYGIDFYRNGRLIVSNDKSLFHWKNPETGETELEYPVDATFLGGRIVGELEANFAKVTYTKDSIEKIDKHWDALTKKIRGEAPIRPSIAQDYGYEKNTTYIARLFSGYRKANKPGREDLLPGKFNQTKNKWEADNVQPKAWAELFSKGEQEYQDDRKWWDLVEQVEENRRSSNTSGNSIEGNGNEDFLNPNFQDSLTGSYGTPLEGEGNTPITDLSLDEIEVAVTTITIHEEADMGNTYIKDEFLSGVYKVDELGEEGIVLDAFINNDLQQEKPLVIEKLSHSNYKAYYNPNSTVFKCFGNSVKEYLLMELANSLYLRKNDPEEWSISKIFFYLKTNYCKEESLELVTVKSNANNLLVKIKNKLSAADITLLPEVELEREDYQTLQRSVLSKLGEGDFRVKELIKTTKFISYMPNSFVMKFFNIYPQHFFDGIIWRKPFSEIGDSEIQQELVQEFNSYLSDIVWLIKFEEEEVLNNFHRFKRNVESLRALGEQTGE